MRHATLPALLGLALSLPSTAAAGAFPLPSPVDVPPGTVASGRGSLEVDARGRGVLRVQVAGLEVEGRVRRVGRRGERTDWALVSLRRGDVPRDGGTLFLEASSGLSLGAAVAVPEDRGLPRWETLVIPVPRAASLRVEVRAELRTPGTPSAPSSPFGGEVRPLGGGLAGTGGILDGPEGSEEVNRCPPMSILGGCGSSD